MKFESKIIEGVQLGSKFGIATANLELSSIDKHLKEGVYIVSVFFKQEVFKGVFHYGKRKTFGGDLSAEVHILDFQKNIYGENLTIKIKKKLRNIQTFQNADMLFTQIEKDIIKTEKYFKRLEVFEIWENLTKKEKNNLAKVAFEEIQEHELFLKSENVFVYAPDSKEINFIDLLLEFHPHKNFYFPKVNGGNLEFYKVKKYSDLKKGYLEILEPSDKSKQKIPQPTDLIIIPGVAGSNNLERLGRGGGFYDRFLDCLPKEVPTIMVIPEFALFENLPTELHDKKVDEIMAL